VAIVFVIGLTLAYVSFSRFTAVTDSAAGRLSARSPSCRPTGSARSKVLDEAAAKGWSIVDMKRD
jgi:hypothetical protein